MNCLSQTRIGILPTAVHADEVVNSLSNPAHGGQTCFFGRVRHLNHGRKVKAVTYDCFGPMAEKVLGEIICEARSRWGADLDVIVLHGTGRIEVGQVSVGIGVSSPHREEAFEACRYVIEELKVRVPIWKQEHYIDGDSDWLRGHELCRHGATP